MDEQDTIVGIKGEVIHTYNKNEAAIKDTEYYTLVRERSNVLLMGDNIGDAQMAEGMEHCDVVIKVHNYRQRILLIPTFSLFYRIIS